MDSKLDRHRNLYVNIQGLGKITETAHEKKFYSVLINTYRTLRGHALLLFIIIIISLLVFS